VSTQVSNVWQLDPSVTFTQYSEKWDRLNQSGPRSPLLTALFMSSLLKEFGTGDEILAVCRPTDPVAMAILCRRSRIAWETFQPSQAPLGAWLQRPEADTEELARSLIKALPGFGLTLGITQLDPDLFKRPEDSDTLNTINYIQTARITIRGTFEEYWARRGKNLRHNLKRQRNQLAQQGIECRVEAVTSRSDVAAAVAEYAKLETAGWKAESGTAVRSGDRQGRFYRQLLEDHCVQRHGRIYQLRLGGRIAAADLCIDNGSTLVVLKTSYDETMSNLSPALLMRQEYFRELFGAGLRRIEFYGRVMEWHTKWSDEIRTMFHINCFRSSVFAALHRVRRGVKSTYTEPEKTSVSISQPLD
jgi:CelD/BcsL family acetyltransferase involved in cellulose biosynthesis